MKNKNESSPTELNRLGLIISIYLHYSLHWLLKYFLKSNGFITKIRWWANNWQHIKEQTA